MGSDPVTHNASTVVAWRVVRVLNDPLFCGCAVDRFNWEGGYRTPTRQPFRHRFCDDGIVFQACLRAESCVRQVAGLPAVRILGGTHQ